MRRRLGDFTSLVALKHLRYIPLMIFKIENWLPLISNYLGFRDSGETYLLRNGVRIKTAEGAESANIVGVFIKKVYGAVDDNSVIIDIGAHIGVYSVFAASTSKNTVVYAYEPAPPSFNLLLENIELNNLENILAFNLGVCGRKEKRRLHLSDSDSSLHSLYSNKGGKSLEIECVSLKDIFIENEIGRCDILKLNCEGAEFEILYNTPKEYLKKIKRIILQYHDKSMKRNHNIKSLLDFLRKRGFRAVKFKRRPAGVWLERQS